MGGVQLNKLGTLSEKQGERQPKEKDWDRLTGVMKKNIAEKKIAFKINERRGGTLFLCDVDGLERINRQYGHQAGDECLKQVAQILSFMISPDDILGRSGGDEFVIFMPSCRDAQQAQEICARIGNRFRANRGKGNIPLSVTVVHVMWQSGLTYEKLFECAAEKMKKQREDLEIQKEQKDKEGEHYIKDVRQIRKELIEQIKKPGAYCRDYETFKSIYRFLERGIIRSGQKACVILITVVDKQGRSLLPQEKDVLMEQLGKNIESALRIGDVYTRYSSSQYLALVIDTTEGQTDLIVSRIKERFLAGRQENNILIHHCYELQPAQIGERIEGYTT